MSHSIWLSLIIELPRKDQKSQSKLSGIVAVVPLLYTFYQTDGLTVRLPDGKYSYVYDIQNLHLILDP